VRRNLAVLAEAAVRNFVLNQRGIDSTKEFIERQQQLMEDGNQELSPSGLPSRMRCRAKNDGCAARGAAHREYAFGKQQSRGVAARRTALWRILR
jgi:hypothetical protein